MGAPFSNHARREITGTNGGINASVSTDPYTQTFLMDEQTYSNLSMWSHPGKLSILWGAYPANDVAAVAARTIKLKKLVFMIIFFSHSVTRIKETGVCFRLTTNLNFFAVLRAGKQINDHE